MYTAQILAISLATSFLIQVVFFTYAMIRQTDKVTDLAYGLTFVAIAAGLYIINPFKDLPKLLLLLTIAIWGIRLATYLFIRIKKMRKDKRFDGIRESFVKFASFWILQALSVWIILIPSSFVLSISKELEFNILQIIGLVIANIGILIESIADAQKFKFKSDEKNKGKWIQTGLWKYSRHPNYFGELTVWWGIFLATLGYLNGLELFSIISPIYISILILFVSGIPTLEKKYDQRYKDNKRYFKYKNSTSLLIPMPQKN